jgi:hypothetical protein
MNWSPPAPAIASPELTPMRIASWTPCRSAIVAFSSPRRASISRAAWSARSGSSSWAVGMPKTDMTASPMNFSTTPPHDSITEAIAAK